VPSIVLANLVIGENVVPERIQRECNPERLTADLLPLLGQTALRNRQIAGFERLGDAMDIGDQSPSGKAASIVFEYLNR
jgi:lipid-A-disaccharide synthase